MSLKIGTFFPFPATAYINGHSFIAESLKKKQTVFHKEDNAFLKSGSPELLQKIADELSPEIITKRLNYWLFLLGPKFSKQERAEMNLDRSYSSAQIEYCKNTIFNRHFPLTRLFQTACQHGFLLLQATSISRLFGRRITRRFKGKLQHILEKSRQGYFVLCSYFKNGMVKQYVKHRNYLRTEVTSNNLPDLKIRKNISNLSVVRETFSAIADQYLQHQAGLMQAVPEALADVTLYKPVLKGKTRIPGIRIEDIRMHRVMETLLHMSAMAIPVSNSGVYARLLEMHHLSESEYSFGQLRYDMRKMRAHGLVVSIGKTYTYRLTEAGVTISASMDVLVDKIFTPAFSRNSLKFADTMQQDTPLLKLYKRLDDDFDMLIKIFNRAA